MCFMLDERDLLFIPVDILQLQFPDVADAQAEPGGKQDHRITSFSRRTNPFC